MKHFKTLRLILLIFFLVSVMFASGCTEGNHKTEIIDLTGKKDSFKDKGSEKKLTEGTDGNNEKSGVYKFSETGDDTENPEFVQETISYIICEIKGEIRKPGVYKLKEGDRLNDLVRIAGGLTENADPLAINLAVRLEDGQSVIVPDRFSDNTALIEAQNSKDKEKDSKININTATSSELETIPGIGPATAANIIKYREDNGPFKSIEDITKVNRIGDKTFEKIKDYIKIK